MKKILDYPRSLIFFLFILLPLQSLAQQSPGKLISTQWLQENLQRPDTSILDVRTDIKEYWKGHIPGALYIHPEAFRWPEKGVPGNVISPRILAQLLGNCGISQDTSVIVYGEKNDYFATYIIWALDYLGHHSSAMLDGGFDRWQKEKRPLTQAYIYPTPVEHTPHNLDRAIYADLGQVKQGIDNPGTILLDVRPRELYTGEKGFWIRNGHIKGAIHRFWGDDLAEDGSWKNPDELKQIYASLGVTPNKKIITSCGQGQMSSHTYFTLRYILGFPNVANYDGGFNEWSSYEDLPIEKGEGQTATTPAAPTPTAISQQPDGKRLIESRCTQCHTTARIYDKKRHARYWEKTVDRMIQRGAVLNTKERLAVINHLSSR